MPFTPSGHRPLNDTVLAEGTTSIGATPVPVVMVSPSSGILHKIWAAAGGTTTGTIAIAVSINGGADITGGAFTIAAGNNARAGSSIDFTKVGSGTIWINEGDIITLTPSGGGGASIPGAFTAIIRAV
ncbi:hypothetical protein [Bradyrhizobium ivorense]|uniref:hypothetical protein n=1 Tax=Bradyrhizobium ivorense TaxID=2511166 RepID=UPI0010B3B913|nr:hypothetical protein [Bradyrhizobium ivorense]VIO73890.1 hypothetical protein CI41S_39990 [Bradyrhizobium ivorense]